MMGLSKLILLAMLSFSTGLCSDHSSNQIWRQFCEKPTALSFKICANQVDSTLTLDYASYELTTLDTILISETSEWVSYYYRIAQLTLAGDVLAARMLAKLYWFYNPAPEIQQMTMEFLGVFSEKYPKVFFEILKENTNPRESLRHEMSYCNTIAFSTGNHFGVTKKADRVNHLKIRKAKYLAIDDPMLLDIRDAIIECINDYLKY